MRSIIEKARDGSREAQAELYRVFADELGRYIARHMGQRIRRFVTVEDIEQDVFGRVFASLDSLPKDAGLAMIRSRLYRHARWVLSNVGRQVEHLPPHLDEDASIVDNLGGRDGATVTQIDELRRLESLVEHLPPSYAAVVVLRMHGHDFRHIARRLDVTEATARKRWTRGCTELRSLRYAAKRRRRRRFGHSQTTTSIADG